VERRGGFPDRFANNHVIPHFNQNGTALTREERAAIAKRKGTCVNCGVKTHIAFVFTKRLTTVTNDNVCKGVCIKCNPTSVPSKILQECEVRNPRTNAPAVPASRQQPRVKRAVTNPVASSAGSRLQGVASSAGSRQQASRATQPFPPVTSHPAADAVSESEDSSEDEGPLIRDCTPFQSLPSVFPYHADANDEMGEC